MYVNVALKTAVPSMIQIGTRNRKYRAWHQGQRQTCWKCGEAEHQAKDCPKRPPVPVVVQPFAAAARAAHDIRAPEDGAMSSRGPADSFAAAARRDPSERSDHNEKSFLQPEGTLNTSNMCTTKSKTSEVQADSKGQSSSSVNTADIAVREDDAGAPSPDTDGGKPPDVTAAPDIIGETPRTPGGKHEHGLPSVLETNESSDSQLCTSSSWADSTRTDDELDPVDLITSTPQPVVQQIKRPHPAKGIKKNRKKRKARK